MPFFRKKPVVIEAHRVDDLVGAPWEALPQFVKDAYDAGDLIFLPDGVDIKALEGWHFGGRGDMLIRGVKGELYPCKGDIFEMTYEEA